MGSHLFSVIQSDHYRFSYLQWFRLSRRFTGIYAFACLYCSPGLLNTVCRSIQFTRRWAIKIADMSTRSDQLNGGFERLVETIHAKISLELSQILRDVLFLLVSESTKCSKYPGRFKILLQLITSELSLMTVSRMVTISCSGFLNTLVFK